VADGGTLVEVDRDDHELGQAPPAMDSLASDAAPTRTPAVDTAWERVTTLVNWDASPE
jgi:hypothetical protein